MRECNVGRVHSIETMGLVDGPGIRTVVFFQGCNLECIYCHNPDAWDFRGGYHIASEQLVNKILRYKPYFHRSGGGVTFSGGECLLQDEFLLEVLKKCKEKEIHTAIDTSGYGKGHYEDILKYTDLVLLDIKHLNDEGYKSITNFGILELEKFIGALNNSNAKVWIRHVIIPGITDSEDHIKSLKQMAGKVKNIEKIQLLPYHSMGEHKYERLGIPYKLKGVRDLHQEDINLLNDIIKSE